jgi:hypothetical protein
MNIFKGAQTMMSDEAKYRLLVYSYERDHPGKMPSAPFFDIPFLMS